MLAEKAEVVMVDGGGEREGFLAMMYLTMALQRSSLVNCGA